MGSWSTTLPHGTKIKDFLIFEELRSCEVLAASIVNRNEFYAAARNPSYPSGDVIAFMCMLSFAPKTREIWWKPMEESMGPHMYNCPEKILALLTETDSEYAKNWRKANWEEINRRKALPKITPGCIIMLEEPIKWSDGVREDKYLRSNGKWRRMVDMRRVKLVHRRYSYSLYKRTP